MTTTAPCISVNIDVEQLSPQFSELTRTKHDRWHCKFRYLFQVNFMDGENYRTCKSFITFITQSCDKYTLLLTKICFITLVTIGLNCIFGNPGIKRKSMTCLKALTISGIASSGTAKMNREERQLMRKSLGASKANGLNRTAKVTCVLKEIDVYFELYMSNKYISNNLCKC